MAKELSDVACRKAKAETKAYKLADMRGLHLLVSPNGSKGWRLRYRWQGKEQMLSLGVYPDVSLAMARERRDEARRQLAEGLNPSAHKKAEKQRQQLALGSSFEAISREWLEKHSPNWTPEHGERIRRRLEVDVWPWLGAQDVAEIKPVDVLTVLRRIEERGALQTAHRARSDIGLIYRYAVATGRAQRDVTADLRGALPPVKEKHHGSITEPAKVGELLRAIDVYRGGFITRCALRLSPLVFVRPGELRAATWEEFDLDAAEWRIPAQRMKMRVLHIVPLCRQAVEILRELEPLTGRGIPAKPELPRYLFPGVRSRERPMSEVAILAALRRMGYAKGEMTAHGFRSMANTLLHEQGWLHDAIERQLAHADQNRVSAAYNYAEHLPERRLMMQAWADYLDALREGKKTAAAVGSKRAQLVRAIK